MAVFPADMRNRATVPSLSLFTGAGGLDIGLREAGFRSRLCIEVDASARGTLRANDPRIKLAEPGDIHRLTMFEVQEQSGLQAGDVGLVFGGPPCQPFSKAALWNEGKVSRLRDPRASTLHAMMDAVDHFLPEVLLLENVTGFATRGRNSGVAYIQRRLKATNDARGTGYRASLVKLNAADYGVPQRRERVFLLAERAGKRFVAPRPSHIDPALAASGEDTWRNTWDAIGHLGNQEDESLQASGKWADLLPSIPEGSNYLWHTERGGGSEIFGWRRRYWTFLLKLAKSLPSWTIQADPGPSTGPFHWSNRRLSVAELAALQTFPATHKWVGTYREVQSQIGNAVPPGLAAVLGAEICSQLLGKRRPNVGLYIPDKRTDCPLPERVRTVPRRYRNMQLDRSPHPGTGLGPRAMDIA